MKKFLSLCLSLFILLGTLCACKSDKKTSASDSSVSPAQIYLDNASVWEVQSEETSYGYMFIDLNFDGILELVQSVKEPRSDKSTNKFFKLDIKSKSVSEIPCSDDDAINLWNFEGGDYPQLYKNNETGTLKYMVYDNSREEATRGGTRIGEMTYSTEEGIRTRSLWGFVYASLDGSYSGEYTYAYLSYDEQGNKNDISPIEYTKLLEDYENKNTNMNLRFKYISQTTADYTYSLLSKEAKLNILTEAYNAFGYGN